MYSMKKQVLFFIERSCKIIYKEYGYRIKWKIGISFVIKIYINIFVFDIYIYEGLWYMLWIVVRKELKGNRSLIVQNFSVIVIFQVFNWSKKENYWSILNKRVIFMWDKKEVIKNIYMKF